MDINDEVRFRVSPDIIGPNEEHAKRHDKRSGKKENHKHVIKARAPIEGSPRHLKSSKALTSGYRFQAVVNQDGLIELDLSGRKLSSIPEEVLRLARLEVLNISNNELRSFTSQLSLLYRLKKLDASWNSLLALPETFTNLKHLKELDLSHNALQTLPGNIQAFVHLRLLKLDFNKLENLPHQTGFLPSLKVLSLSGNQLWHLPKSFTKLSKIKRLDLSSNTFDQFPPAVCNLCDLELLDIHDNHILNLPAEFERLQKLKELNLSENQFEAVPYILSQLSQLRSLDLSNNRIIGIPPRFYKLAKLRILNLQKNQLRSLPILPAPVEYLNVSQNRIHTLSISKNKHLKHLNASYNTLEDMPLGIYNQKHLEVLKLGHNRIGYVSQDVILLQKLRHFDLSHNQLRSLPQVIYELQKLQTFNIKGNQIQRRVGEGAQNGGMPNLFYSNGSQGLHKSKRIEPMQERHNVPKRHGHHLHYDSDSQVNYEDYEDHVPPKHFNGNLDNGKFVAPHPGVKRNYKRSSEIARKQSKRRSWFKWGKRKEKAESQNKSWPQRKTFGTQYTPVSHQGTRIDRRQNTSKEYNSLSYHDIRSTRMSGNESRGIENYLQSHTLPLPGKTITSSNEIQANHKDVAEINYPLNQLDGKPPTNRHEQRDSLGNPSSYRRQETPRNTGVDSYERMCRSYPNSVSLSNLKQPSYSTIAIVSTRASTTHRNAISECSSSSNAAATVAEWETVGDELSLGDEDYEYQPTSVEDKRLRGVVDGVERLLNKQLMDPVTTSNKGKQKQDTTDQWPSRYISFRKYPRNHHKYDYTSEDETSWYSVPETRTSLQTEPHRLVPRKNDIIMKSPSENNWNVLDSNSLRRKSAVRFTVTPGGGTFCCKADRNIKVQFPVGAVEYPVECKLQVQPIQKEDVDRARFYHHSTLSNLVAIGPIVTVTCAEPITLNMPVSLTLPDALSESSGYLHILNCHKDLSCTPCTAKRTRNHGHVSIDVWNLSGKCTALTKSKDPIQCSSTVEHLLQVINFK